MPSLNVILGPTGIGKTALATSEARRTGAPVVVLDRIQCYPEIANASGRPRPSETAGTTRIYLAERGMEAGELSPEEGMRRFDEVIAAAWSAGHDLVIVEGGSISLCEQWRTAGLLRERSVRVLEIGADEDSYAGRVLQRVRELVAPDSSDGESMIDEFADSWRRYEAQRGFLSSICGFDAIVRWCRNAGILPEDLSARQLSTDQRDQLVSEITSAHCSYAHTQSAYFAGLRWPAHA